MKKKKGIIFIILAVVFILILFGVFLFTNKGKTTYKYNLDKINHCKEIYITKTEYYKNKVKIYFNCSIENINIYCPDDTSLDVKKSIRNITIYTDNPEKITSINADTDWMETSFRYLDTDEYAMIWHYWADDLGWTEYKGNTSKFYTEEEKRKQQEELEKKELERKLRKNESKLISGSVIGTWISQSGDYFEISEYKENSYILKYYLAAAGIFDSDQFVDFKWIDEDNRAIAIYHNSTDFFDESVYYEIVLSEDDKSFSYNNDIFYLIDEELNITDEFDNQLDEKYVKGIKILLDSSDDWRFRDDEISDNSIVEYKYAITDLDEDGFLEVIKSGYTEDNHAYSVIYEVQMYDSVAELNSNLIKDRSFTQLPPNLYDFEKGVRYNFQDSYGYRYLVEGNEQLGDNGYFKQYYLMCLVNNSVILEKLCAMEDDGAGELSYYNANGDKIKYSDYSSIFSNIDGKKKHYVSFGWFEEINEENLETSIRTFLISLQKLKE